MTYRPVDLGPQEITGDPPTVARELAPATDHTKPAPGEAWQFDEAVAGVFDDMLRRSIPDFETMREIVFGYGSRLVQEGTFLVDYGASLGGSLAPFLDRFGVHARYVALDSSPAMLAALRARFGSWNDVVEIREADLAVYFPPKPVSLTLAIFAVQFVPLEDRPAVLRRIYEATLPGGGLILAEKVRGSDAAAQAAIVGEYHALKARNGYSAEEIASKAASLRGVLVPLTAAENEAALRAAGFETVEGIWRAHNFAAWIAVRRP